MRNCRTYEGATERHFKARKAYRCDSCLGTIPKGSEYVIATEYPRGPAGYADSAGRPVRWRLHDHPPCHYCGPQDGAA